MGVCGGVFGSKRLGSGGVGVGENYLTARNVAVLKLQVGVLYDVHTVHFV
jgi:hypothetical protein